MRECTYLGHIFGNGEVKPERSKLQAIAQFPLPTTKKQVWSFLGLTGYYRHSSLIKLALLRLSPTLPESQFQRV